MALGEWNVIAILGFVFTFVFFPVGIVLCCIALLQLKEDKKRGEKLAIAGLCISGLIILASLLFAITHFSMPEFGIPRQEKCHFESGLTCYNSTLTTTTARLNIYNGFGQEINIVNTTITNRATNATCSGYDLGRHRSGYDFTLFIDECAFAKAFVKADIEIWYYVNQPQFERVFRGEIHKYAQPNIRK